MPEESPLLLGVKSLKDSLTHRVREILILLISTGLISWFFTNYPIFRDQATVYFVLGIFSLLGIIILIILQHIFGLNFIRLTLAEQGFVKVNKKILLILGILLFLLTFFFIGKSQYAIFAPRFQVVELGLFGNILMTIPSAIVEDFFFFSFLFSLLFSLLLLYFRSPMLPLVFSSIVIPFIFLIYHTLVYGFADVTNSFAVTIYGFEQILWMVLVRDLMILHFRHIGNNLAKTIFSQMTLTAFFLILLKSIYFWLTLFILIFIIFMWFRFLRKRKIEGVDRRL